MDFQQAYEILENPKNVRFADLLKVCRAFFGEPRVNGTSHHIFKTPWSGDPRINIQMDGKNAKSYQVKQVKQALKKLEDLKKQGAEKEKKESQG